MPTGISWTEETWNPVTGCSKVSPGCANCYAETLTARFAGRPGYIEEHRPWTPENAAHNVRLHPERLDQPLRWKRPRMIFVNSMSDLFHERVPDSFICQVFDVMARASQHTFQVLTKRPERIAQFFTDAEYTRRQWYLNEHLAPVPLRWLESGPLPNVWLGVSIENARHTWRADVLREIPAAVRFISAEPLLGSLYNFGSESSTARDDDEEPDRASLPALTSPSEGDRSRDSESNGSDVRPSRSLRGVGTQPAPVAPERSRSRQSLDLTDIDWLIVGGESGSRDARPMHPEWARELRDACLDFGAHELTRPAFFYKQTGSWRPLSETEPRGDTVALQPDGTKRPAHEALPNKETAWMRYAGASPKSGGKLLDGREWCEFPETRVLA